VCAQPDVFGGAYDPLRLGVALPIRYAGELSFPFRRYLSFACDSIRGTVASPSIWRGMGSLLRRGTAVAAPPGSENQTLIKGEHLSVRDWGHILTFHKCSNPRPAACLDRLLPTVFNHSEVGL